MDIDDTSELQIIERLREELPVQATLTLPFDSRRKSRLRTRLDDGRDVGLFLARAHLRKLGLMTGRD